MLFLVVEICVLVVDFLVVASVVGLIPDSHFVIPRPASVQMLKKIGGGQKKQARDEHRGVFLHVVVQAVGRQAKPLEWASWAWCELNVIMGKRYPHQVEEVSTNLSQSKIGAYQLAAHHRDAARAQRQDPGNQVSSTGHQTY